MFQRIGHLQHVIFVVVALSDRRKTASELPKLTVRSRYTDL